MKIVIVAPEIAPFAKTGGLADLTGMLPNEIRSFGHEVIAFLPRYKCVDIDKRGLEIAIDQISVPLGSEKKTGRVYRQTAPNGVQFYFMDCPDFFNRDELYGTAYGDYPDNDLRFTFFQRGILEALKALKIRPDIIHCHDWQSGLIPVYLKTVYASDPLFQNTKVILTIHNLGYQGNFPPDSLPATGLNWDLFRMEKLEFYGKISFLKGGIVYADALTTVSQRYAEEIQTKEHGCGLEGVLVRQRDHLFGVLNGLDYHEWNPETDPDLAANYSLENLENKIANKKALQKENRFEVDPKIPLYGIVSRLVDQKGIDILISAMPEIADLGIQFVLLGTGDEKYHQLFRELAKRNRDSLGIHIVFDAKMAKRIYAGCDVMLMPSLYEPCGLAQMIAMRYGSVPLVRAAGGLIDTVQEFDPKTGKGNGFCMKEYSSADLVAALKRSLEVYKDKKNWNALVTNARKSDFSWTASARKFVKLYEQIKKRTHEDVERL